MKCPNYHAEFGTPEDTLNIDGDGLIGKIIELYVFDCKNCGHSYVVTATFETKLVEVDFAPNDD